MAAISSTQRPTVTLAPLSADLLNSAKEAQQGRKSGGGSNTNNNNSSNNKQPTTGTTASSSSASAGVGGGSNGLTPFSPSQQPQAGHPRRNSGPQNSATPTTSPGPSSSNGAGGSNPTSSSDSAASGSDQPILSKVSSSGNMVHLNSTSGSKHGARARMNELYKFWCNLPETQRALKDLVDSSLAQAKREKKVGDSGDLNPNDSLMEDVEAPLEAQGSTPFVVVEPVPPSDLNNASVNSSSGVGSPGRQGFAKSVTSPERAPAFKGGSPSATMEPPLSPNTRPLRPKSPSPQSPRDPRRQEVSPQVTHIVDELDAAHRRGGLSPRVKDLSPHRGDDGNRAVSPMEFSLTPNTADFHPADSLHSTTAFKKGNRLSASNVSNAGGSEPSLSRRNSLSQSELHQDKRGESSTNSSRSSSPMQSSRSEHLAVPTGATPAKAAPTPVFPVASVEDIPPFYFTAGKKLKDNDVVQLDASAIHPNAPPTLPPAVQKQQQAMLAQMAENGGGGAGVFSNGLLDQPQPINIPALVAMTDNKVEEFVTKNFSSIKSTPSASSSSSAAGSAVLARRAIRSGQGSRKNSNASGGGNSKSDAVHWQHISAAMHRITTQCFGLPGYFSRLIIAAIVKKTESGEVRDESSITSTLGGGARTLTVAQVMEFYHTFFKGQTIVRRMFNVLIASSKHPSSRDIGKITRNHLLREDFSLPLEVLLELHPGLAFLRQAQDFQSKYVDTVILRVFYDVDVFDRGRITWPEFDRSKLPEVLRQVDVIEDINSVLNYFSYEHFYVIYCRFWELDEDKDGKISPEDLERYTPEGCLNPELIERVFKGHGRRMSCPTKHRMNYEDFVYFCLSEEDKSHPRAIRYWFRILDTDGDGILSGYELEEVYNYTKSRMIMITSECIQFPDVMCQIRDMLPYEEEGPSLADLLRYPQSAFVALNMVTNVAKFLQFEQRDPFVAHQDRLAGGLEKTEWDRFARNEYNRMALEAEGEV